jgi:predicted RNase H-like HicB family nuclease
VTCLDSDPDYSGHYQVSRQATTSTYGCGTDADVVGWFSERAGEAPGGFLTAVGFCPDHERRRQVIITSLIGAHVKRSASKSWLRIGMDGYKMTNIKVIVEKHSDGYIAYPLGLKGVVVGEGDTYEDALADVRSAIRFHIETFGDEVLQAEPPVLEAFVAESGVAI